MSIRMRYLAPFSHRQWSERTRPFASASSAELRTSSASRDVNPDVYVVNRLPGVGGQGEQVDWGLRMSPG